MKVEGRGGTQATNVFLGVCFILGGVLLLLNQLDVLPVNLWHDGWPYLVMIVGVGTVVTAASAERVGSGVMFIGFALWWLAAVNHWHGLTWRTSWPLGLVAMGAGTLAHAIAAWFLPEKIHKRAVIGEEPRHDA